MCDMCIGVVNEQYFVLCAIGVNHKCALVCCFIEICIPVLLRDCSDFNLFILISDEYWARWWPKTYVYLVFRLRVPLNFAIDADKFSVLSRSYGSYNYYHLLVTPNEHYFIADSRKYWLQMQILFRLDLWNSHTRNVAIMADVFIYCNLLVISCVCVCASIELVNHSSWELPTQYKVSQTAQDKMLQW